MPYRSYGLTDVGKKRDHNEDSFFISDELGLYIVADGMGGHAAGEVASAKAVEVMGDFVRRCQEDDEFTWPYGINPELDDLQNTIVTAVKLANREVWRLAQEKADHHGMGTTIACLHIYGDRAAIAHVGDSRVYLMRNGKLIQKTRDHSWVNEQLVRGIISPEEAKNHRWKNVITRALGNKEQIEVDVTTEQMQPGDIILLCSDGMSLGDGVEEEDVLARMVENQSDMHAAAQLLIGMANDAGGRDNITTVLVKCYTSQEEADAENRDRSKEDTNPLALKSVAPPGVDSDTTSEMGADFAAKAQQGGDENLLDEPIEFDEDEATPRLGGIAIKPEDLQPSEADRESETEAAAEKAESATEQAADTKETEANEAEQKVAAGKDGNSNDESDAAAASAEEDEDLDPHPAEPTTRTAELAVEELGEVFEEDDTSRG